MSDIVDKVHFSSKSPEWGTPQWLFDELNKEFHFDVDVCATAVNAKCSRWYSPEIDGLSQVWRPKYNHWMNPPYGRKINRWIKKAYESAQSGSTVVCLVPARTDTKWWHNYCMKGEVRFLQGRLYFTKDGEDLGKDGRAPFPSAIVIFRPMRSE